METLYLRFLSYSEQRVIDEDTTVRWVLFTDDEEVGNHGKIKLSNASSLIQDRKVVILLPIEDLFITTVTVQTKNRKQLEKAIPYALEDDLAEDIEELHFAIGQRTHSGDIPVLVISKAKLDHLIDVLSGVNILPDIITADIFGLHRSDKQWIACVEEQHVIARTGQWSGFGCEAGDFKDFIQIANEADVAAPEIIEVFRHPDEDMLEITQVPNVYIHDNWSPIAYIQGFQDETSINLLQGPYAKADKQHKTTRPWKIAAALAGIWVALSIAQVSIEYWKLNRINNELNADIEQVFRRAFPEIKNVVNARVQMEQRIKELTNTGSSSGNADFLKLLHHSGYELNKDKNTSINGVQYKGNELSLDINAGDVQILENVKSKLLSKNIKAELKSAESVNNKIQARMLVSE